MNDHEAEALLFAHRLLLLLHGRNVAYRSESTGVGTHPADPAAAGPII